MSTVGRRLLSALVREGNVTNYVKMSLDKALFRDGEVVLFDAINTHLGKYGALPKQVTIETWPGFEDSITDAPEPSKFYLEETEKRFLHTALKGGVNEITTLLAEKYADEALEVFTRVTTDLYKRKQRRHVTDFRESAGIVHKQYMAQKAASGTVALPFGWGTLDDMSGGARSGDFISIVGRPMQGKTFLMLATARHGWRYAPRTPLIVSMEMHANLIHQRLAAMETSTKLSLLMKGELSTKAYFGMQEKLKELESMQRPLWVVDGSVVKTVDDVIMQCHILQPDCLWIDAAYLLKKSHPKMGKWEAMSENAERLKEQVATDLEMPVICSYQLSKDSAKAKKKNKDEKASMEDIYGSDAIAQLSSVILGLFQFENDVEAMYRRKIEILKGRSGETGEFTVNWNFAKMDFSEYKPEKPDEVQMNYAG